MIPEDWRMILRLAVAALLACGALYAIYNLLKK